MTQMKKMTLIILGALAAILVVSQLVMGQIILSGPDNVEKIKKAHQHSGYLTVVAVLGYIGFSLATIASLPARAKD
jgi:hypothetical protein